MTPPGPKNNNESAASILARIDERTLNIEESLGNFMGETKDRLNNHATRIRKVELSNAVTNGEAKGRDFSFKRLATWAAIIGTAIAAIIGIIKITPP